MSISIHLLDLSARLGGISTQILRVLDPGNSAEKQCKTSLKLGRKKDDTYIIRTSNFRKAT